MIQSKRGLRPADPRFDPFRTRFEAIRRPSTWLVFSEQFRPAPRTKLAIGSLCVKPPAPGGS